MVTKNACSHTPTQMVTKKSMLSYAKSNGNEKNKVTQDYLVSNLASTVT